MLNNFQLEAHSINQIKIIRHKAPLLMVAHPKTILIQTIPNIPELM
jgi:hypothetical protein